MASPGKRLRPSRRRLAAEGRGEQVRDDAGEAAGAALGLHRRHLGVVDALAGAAQPGADDADEVERREPPFAEAGGECGEVGGAERRLAVRRAR